MPIPRQREESYWIHTAAGNVYCKACGYVATFANIAGIAGIAFKYCPNCGCRMTADVAEPQKETSAEAPKIAHRTEETESDYLTRWLAERGCKQCQT